MRGSVMGCLAAAATLALAGCGAHRPDARGVDRNEVLLQVSANGHADTHPDEARFAVGVSSIGATSQSATEANNVKMNAVVAALKGLGVTEADIQTKQLTVSREEWGANRGKFEASNVVEVHMRAVDKAGAAIAAATQSGANIMWGPNLSVSDPEGANRSAYAAAFKAARARAETYAEAAGLKVARVLRIRDGAGAAPTPLAAQAYAGMAEADNAAPAPPVLAGTTTAEVTVNVDFALGPK